MINIELETDQSGYNAIGKYIKAYWNHNIQDTVIIFMEISFDGINYKEIREIAYPINYNDVEFLYDWGEGEQFIRLLGIQSISKIDVCGTIYDR